MSDLFSIEERAEVVVLPDADIRITREFLTPQEASEKLAVLVENTKWRQEEVTVWGKKHLQPRLIAWHGDVGASYAYSGTKLDPAPWTEVLLWLKARVEAHTRTQFNSVLLNYYRNQNDSMGWHSDNEPELGARPTIASISLGDTRIFLLKHKFRKDLAVSKIPLPSGSLLLMAGDTQTFWQHSINRETKIAGPRVNLTFRFIDVSQRP